jgi:hypothetical protein
LPRALARIAAHRRAPVFRALSAPQSLSEVSMNVFRTRFSRLGVFAGIVATGSCTLAACTIVEGAVSDSEQKSGDDRTFPGSASNGVKDGSETDRDCGGTEAPTCASGRNCRAGSDCATAVCSIGLCQGSSTSDGVKNADETDVDCGGASAQSCTQGKKCKASSDCDALCTNAICDAASDRDGKRNAGETDVDCGGVTAKKCGIGKACATNSDCGLGNCFQSACALPSGTDGRQNGSESDVDCGGATQTFEGVTATAAAKCVAAKRCSVDNDCEGAVCSDSKTCVEAPSCRPLHGGQTCGAGEYGAAGATHESCCKSLPVPGLSVVLNGTSKSVVLDKYEVTAGRVRAWIAAIRAQFGGVPNIQEWIRVRRLTDSVLASAIPESLLGYLPSQASDQPIKDAGGADVYFPVLPLFTGTPTSEFYNLTTTKLNGGLWSQLGPTSYRRGVTVEGSSGCSMAKGAYGHRTYYIDEATEPGFSAYFGGFEVVRAPSRKNDLDEKSMNCMTPLMFAAFCAWDGGYVQSSAVLEAAYGTERWPWGAAPAWESYFDSSVAAEREFRGNYNHLVNTTAFNNTRRPAYNFPELGDQAWASDYSPLIAAPGRFPMDTASVARPGTESWMDLGGNMIEWSSGAVGAYKGWTGASWEGHVYPRSWASDVDRMDKYGKGGARCMRLQ